MLGGINGTTTLSKDARVERRGEALWPMRARAAWPYLGSIRDVRADGAARARGLPGVGKQGNKPRRSGYPKVSTSVEPFSSYLTSELCCRFFPRVHPRSVPHHLVGTSGLVTTRST